MADGPQEKHLACLTVALGIATAWRDREIIGTETVSTAVREAIVEHGAAPMVYALADLLTSVISGLEKSVDMLLETDPVLRSAVERLPDDPMRSKELELDAMTVLTKIGLWAASLPA